MADTKISALTAVTTPAGTDEFAVNQGAVSKKLTLDQVKEYIIKQDVASTVARGDYLTTLLLDQTSPTITGTSQTSVMEVSGCDSGFYHFRCRLIYRTTATSTGVDVSVNHTGATDIFYAEVRFAGTGSTASTAAATGAGTNATGNIYEAQATRTMGGLIGAGTVSVDSAAGDNLLTIEGWCRVTSTGTLQIRLAAESAGLACTARAGSFLELWKLT